MPRPLIATIDTSSLQHNLYIAKSCSPNAKIYAVVKANAYGHGLEYAVSGFKDADGLALVEPEGAFRLRELGWRKPILLLEGIFDATDLEVVMQAKVDFTIHSFEQITLLEKTSLKGPFSIHLKMNTGMNRLGFKPVNYRIAYERLRALPKVCKITLMTHFANADDSLNLGLPLKEQIRQFEQGITGLSGEQSIANSAVKLMHPELKSDLVRAGIMLYGAAPGCASAKKFGLRPAMTLRSKIISVQNINSGDTVGYGSRFIATKPMTIGTVACGYADGYPRHAPDGTPVLVNNIYTTLVGRVSMGMLSVDLSSIHGATVGSSVTLWGDGLPIDEVARASGTIGYELMCALGMGVKVVGL